MTRHRITRNSSADQLFAVAGEVDASPQRLREALVVAAARLLELQRYQTLIELVKDFESDAAAEEARAHQE